MSRVLLEVTGLSKTFPGVMALDDVSLTVRSGEIVALVGHNGSGKSTLVKILAGVYGADEGQISTAGSLDEHGADSGLHFIHQDLGLIPGLSTVENLDLGRRLGTRGIRPTPYRRERARARELTRRFGARFDVTRPVMQLTPAERTIVAIARALDGWTSPENVLVLDEPTAALQAEEVAKLFDAVQRVVSDGAGVVLISHRLDEVVDLADRVVVLRDGRVVAEEERGSFDRRSLVALVAGTDEAPEVELARDSAGEEVVLEVRGLTTGELLGVDLTAKRGEIVGLTGLIGSGVEQFGSAVFGARPRGGQVLVDGRPVPANSPRASIRAGMGFAPSDRRGLAAVAMMNARENLTLPRLWPVRGRAGQIRRRAEAHEAQHWMDEVGVVPRGAQGRPFSLFSGGNQQKIVIAKWLRNEPRVLILEEPTQGVDVSAQAGIHQLIAQEAQTGKAVLISSTDTKELVTLCHRVIVLYEGRVGVVLEGNVLTESAVVRASLEGARVVPANGGSGNDGSHRV